MMQSIAASASNSSFRQADWKEGIPRSMASEPFLSEKSVNYSRGSQNLPEETMASEGWIHPSLGHLPKRTNVGGRGGASPTEMPDIMDRVYRITAIAIYQYHHIQTTRLLKFSSHTCGCSNPSYNSLFSQINTLKGYYSSAGIKHTAFVLVVDGTGRQRWYTTSSTLQPVLASHPPLGAWEKPKIGSTATRPQVRQGQRGSKEFWIAMSAHVSSWQVQISDSSHPSHRLNMSFSEWGTQSHGPKLRSLDWVYLRWDMWFSQLQKYAPLLYIHTCISILYIYIYISM